MSILERFKLDGRVALVTGAGTGIGKALALALAEAGASVAVSGRTITTLERTAAEIESRGRGALAIAGDVTIPADVARMVDTVVKAWGRLDIGVNNAGVNNWVEAMNMSEADWDWVFDTNVKGVFLCAQAQARAMFPNRYGKIINIASISAQITNRPQPQVHYNASKAAVVQLTKSLAAEWAPQGIRVNSISPGYTRTEMADAPRTREAQPIWLRDTPLAAMAGVEDLQGAAVYLASAASDFVTGADLVVDGGFTIW